MKTIFCTITVVVVTAIGSIDAPSAEAAYGDSAAGSGVTSSGVAFEFQASGDVGDGGTGSIRLTQDAVEVTASIRCVFVSGTSAFLVGTVTDSSAPFGPDLTLTVEDGEPDTISWGAEATHDCAWWRNPPPREAIGLAFPVVGGGIQVVDGEARTTEQRLADLITELQGSTTAGTGSYLAKLQSTAASIDAGNVEAACGKLDAFANEVRAQTGKKLTQAEADLLLGETGAIRTTVGCE